MPKWMSTFVMLSAVVSAAAQTEYIVDLSNAVHHEARITAVFSNVTADTLVCLMSRSSPGRYALHEFVKNVYSIEFRDANKKILSVIRTSPYEWRIFHPPKQVVLTYTLFGDHADGTYTQIDASHAHLNAPATFVWARGLEDRDHTVTFVLPAGASWKIATQLDRRGNRLYARNFQYLMDSPIEVSDHAVGTYEEDGIIFEIALHSDSTVGLEHFKSIVHAVTSEARHVFGEFPSFDNKRYTFIVDMLPTVQFDAMEHRNSTVITHAGRFPSRWRNVLSAFSHEFFHVWNVERLRPRSLEPFDFMRVNMSGELWLAEGFTNYYDDLIQKRAGVMNIETYADNLSQPINAVLLAPGRHIRSAVEMSEQAGFVDAARSVDVTAFSNTYISYYTYGNAIGLALDLTLRTRWSKSLDDLMQRLWQEFGRKEIPYTNDDVRRCLGQLTNAAFADSFFSRFIFGRDAVDYKTLLASAGLLLRPSHPTRSSIGLSPFAGNTLALNDYPLKGSPLYAVGMDRGDTLTAVDGTAVSDTAALWKKLNEKKFGDSLTIEFRQMGKTKTGHIRLEPDPTLEVVTYEKAGLPVTQSIVQFRKAWLDSKSGRVPPVLVCESCRREYPAEWVACPLDDSKLVLRTK
jgi:predicted metalloprotease with PDZ domain